MRDVESGKDLTDTVRWVKFCGISWTKDGEGFFYSRYAAAHRRQRARARRARPEALLPRARRPRSRRTCWICERPDEPEWCVRRRRHRRRALPDHHDPRGHRARRTGCTSWTWVTRASPNIRSPVVPMHRQVRCDVSLRGQRRRRLLRRDRSATRRAARSWSPMSIRATARRRRKCCVPETEDKIQDVEMVGGHLVVNYLHDAHCRCAGCSTSTGARWPSSRCPGSARSADCPGSRTIESFYTLRVVPVAADGVPLRHRQAARLGRLRGPSSTFDPSTLRDAPGLLQEQGRHARADVHHAREGPGARRAESDVCSTATAASTSASLPTFSLRNARCGSRWAASTRCRTCAAAASTARRGTRPACSSKKQNVFDDFIAAARVPDRGEVHVAGDSSRIEGGSNGGLLVGAVHDAASGPVRRRAAGGGRDGHAALPQVHGRAGRGRSSTAPSGQRRRSSRIS